MSPARLGLRAADQRGVRRSALGSLANSLAFGSLKQRSLSPERLAARASGIFEANKDVLTDPDKIKPGQKLRIPD